jgi:hypothetical protein
MMTQTTGPNLDEYICNACGDQIAEEETRVLVGRGPDLLSLEVIVLHHVSSTQIPRAEVTPEAMAEMDQHDAQLRGMTPYHRRCAPEGLLPDEEA